MKFLKYFLLLLPFIVMTSCDKEEPEEEPESTLPTASYYFQAEIDGELITFEQGKDSYYCGMSGSGGYDASGNVQDETGSFFTQIDIFSLESEGPYFAIDVLKTFPDQYTTEIEDVLTMFEVGNYPYSKEKEVGRDDDGVVLTYSPDGEKYWRSSLEDQTNAMFEMTEVIDNPGSDSFLIFSAEFNCKLYDEEGNSIDLKMGIYRGLAVTFF